MYNFFCSFMSGGYVSNVELPDADKKKSNGTITGGIINLFSQSLFGGFQLNLAKINMDMQKQYVYDTFNVFPLSCLRP